MRKVCEVYLVSSSATDERGVELAFPVSQYEMMDAFEQIHTKSPGDVYWQVDEFYCFDYLAPHLDESMSIFEFNSLTEQLSKLDERQETALEGLLQMQEQKHIHENSGPITAQELLTLAYNTDCCQVLVDVHTDEELGRFYVENGFRDDLDALPEGVYELLDYAKIGRQMREAEKGVFTRSGYVIQMDELKPLPAVQPQQEPPYMIRLTSKSNLHGKTQTILDLPATEAQLHELDWSEMKIVDADAIAPQLNTILTDAEDLPRIHTLAQSLRELKETGQLPKFKAVIQATDCKTLDDVFDRMEKLPQYCFEAKIRDMLPFFLIFEGRKPQSRELVLIAVLVALNVAGRAVFFMLPEFKPVVAMTILAGVAFGGETGFLVGAMTMLVSNMLFSQGPWTPWQMFAMGIIGWLAGILYRKGVLRRSRLSLCIFGVIASTIIYGGIMNPASALMWANTINWKIIVSYYITGVPVDLVRAMATFVFLWLGSEPMLEKLDRVKTKYGLAE